MATRTKKVTFNLHEEVLQDLDAAIARGAAPSKNALVERASVREPGEISREARRKRWQEAAKDLLFMQELVQVSDDSQLADKEPSRGEQ